MAFSHGPYTFDAQADGDAAAFNWTDQTGTTTALQNANTAGRWCWDNNATTSSNVGPDYGQGGNPDGYAYTEMSSQTSGDIFYVEFGSALNAALNAIVFDYYWCARGDAVQTLLQVQTNEAGAGWVNRGNEEGYGHTTIPATSGATVWNRHTVDLTGLVSNASTLVRLRITNNANPTTSMWHCDIGVDTITITGTTLITDPEITNVDDEDFYVGETGVTITGSNFEADGANSRVRIDSASNGTGTSQTQVDTSWATGSIDFTVSLGSLSYGQNYLFVRNQSLNENAAGYLINLYAPITVTSISDSTLYDGQTLVEFNGSGFGSSQGTSEIWISNAPAYLADPDQQEQTVTSWTDTKITFTVDIGFLTLGTSYVFVSRAQASLGDNPLHTSAFETITLVAAPAFPTISSIDGDNSIIFGQTGVIVLGTNFESPQGTGRVDICASATYGSPVLQTETSWGTGSITLTTVQGALSAGINYLFVENDSGLRNAVGFAFTCSEPASPDGLFIEASIQTVITSTGLTTTAFMVRDE